MHHGLLVVATLLYTPPARARTERQRVRGLEGQREEEEGANLARLPSEDRTKKPGKKVVDWSAEGDRDVLLEQEEAQWTL